MARSSAITREPLRQALLLPPGFSAIALREGGDAFAHAVAHAGALGAASIVWVRRFDLIEFAVVLEPEAPLATARLSHYLAMTALADALAVHAPPERPLHFGWPDALVMDHGLVGGGRTAWPADCTEDQTPDWIVFGAMLRGTAMAEIDGLRRLAAPGAGVALDEIGFTDLTSEAVIEGFCRHLMLGVELWTAKGARAIARQWLERIRPETGIRHGLSPEGDLIATGQAGETRKLLIEALREPSWFDPTRGEPKL